MTNKKLVVLFVFIVGCGGPKPQFEFNSDSLSRNLSKDVVEALDSNRLKKNEGTVDSTKDVKKSNPPKNCDDLLFSLIDKSSFNPEVKKFKYTIWVDSLAGNIAILKITLKSDLGDDRAMAWLKLDFNIPKLTDITSDDTSKELIFDTITLRQIMKNCRIR